MVAMPDYRKLADPLAQTAPANYNAPDAMSLAALMQYLPQLNVQTQGAGKPRVSGGLEVPVGQGSLGVEGYYQRPVQQAPADMGAFLRYNRSF
jgi:hypothetical protein